MIGRLKEERDEEREPWIKSETEQGIKLDDEETNKIIVTSKEGYIFHVIVNENGEVAVITEEENVVIADTEKPVINISSITQYGVTFTSTDNIGIVGYSISDSTAPSDEEWTETESTTTLTQTVENEYIHLDGIGSRPYLLRLGERPCWKCFQRIY